MTKKILFTHIPRTGGTTIKRLLKGKITFLKDHTGFDQIQLQQYNNYFKVAFVRNPWERYLSMYIENSINHIFRAEPFEWISFNDYIYDLPNNSMKKRQLEFISFDGQMVADFIGRYENYEKDFYKLCEIAGIKNVKLNLRMRYHGDYDYRKFYNNDTREFVAEYAKRDIDYFNYKFGE